LSPGVGLQLLADYVEQLLLLEHLCLLLCQLLLHQLTGCQLQLLCLTCQLLLLDL
jgi:hypothetical protein